MALNAETSGPLNSISAIRARQVFTTMDAAIKPFVDDPPKWRTGSPPQPQPPPEATLSWTAQTDVVVTEIAALTTNIDWPDFGASSGYKGLVTTNWSTRVTNPEHVEQFVDVQTPRDVTIKDARTGRTVGQYSYPNPNG